MSDDKKIKFFKNKERNEAVSYQPYVPQYQLLGLEPQEYKSGICPVGTPVGTPVVVPNIDKSKATNNQPYAETNYPLIGRGKNIMPNVGNNAEHAWSNVAYEIVDDVGLDPNHPMTDNNDYVSQAAFDFPHTNNVSANILPVANELSSVAESSSTESSSEIMEILGSIEPSNFLLFIKGVPICSGPFKEIEDQAEALMLGNHELCGGEPISDDDIMIFKKLKIKVGITLE